MLLVSVSMCPPTTSLAALVFFTLAICSGVAALSLGDHVGRRTKTSAAAPLPIITGTLMPEISPARLDTVSRLVSAALGDDDDDDAVWGLVSSPSAATGGSSRRYAGARQAAWEFGLVEVTEAAETQKESFSHSNNVPAIHELVYGELSVPVLKTLFDAVGVREGERFLDIGSGDGGLVLGASLLYASGDDDGNDGDEKRNKNAMGIVRGIEIVPGLVDRSKHHVARLDDLLLSAPRKNRIETIGKRAEIEFFLGDVHQAGLDDGVTRILADTTLAVCFATTWSAANAGFNNNNNNNNKRTSLQRRRLPKLSAALAFLPRGARVVLIDGKLNEKADGFQWEGDLRVDCPDTAPYSTASLYERI